MLNMKATCLQLSLKSFSKVTTFTKVCPFNAFLTSVHISLTISYIYCYLIRDGGFTLSSSRYFGLPSSYGLRSVFCPFLTCFSGGCVPPRPNPGGSCLLTSWVVEFCVCLLLFFVFSNRKAFTQCLDLGFSHFPVSSVLLWLSLKSLSFSWTRSVLFHRFSFSTRVSQLFSPPCFGSSASFAACSCPARGWYVLGISPRFLARVSHALLFRPWVVVVGGLRQLLGY